MGGVQGRRLPVGTGRWRKSTDGRSIRKAILYLAPFSFGDRKWDAQQIGTFNPQALHAVLRRAASRYDDAEFQTAVRRLPAFAATDRATLITR